MLEFRGAVTGFNCSSNDVPVSPGCNVLNDESRCAHREEGRGAGPGPHSKSSSLIGRQ